MQQERRTRAAICAELLLRVNRLARPGKGIASDCGSAATGRKLRTGTRVEVLKFARGLLTGDFHVAISDTIGIGRSTVRFATLRFKTRTDFRKPVCGVAREKRPRLFCI